MFLTAYIQNVIIISSNSFFTPLFTMLYCFCGISESFKSQIQKTIKPFGGDGKQKIGKKIEMNKTKVMISETIDMNSKHIHVSCANLHSLNS